MAELFGFSITKLKKVNDPKQSFTSHQADDGTQTVNAGGHFGSYMDMEGTAKTEQDLIRRYREIAIHPECDMAIEDIINEAIVANELKDAVRINVQDLPYGKDVRRKIEDEFVEILRLLQFNTRGHDIFRRWYVDGRLYYQKIIDRESPKRGITELKYIDPRKIKKIREIRKKRPDNPLPSQLANNLSIIDEFVEYYLFNERGLSGTTGTGGIKIAPDTIAFCPSGLVDQNKQMVLSYLQKAIKPVNQLRMIEDAVVIYRIARAPERRIFKIDVGNLPKVKAEQYLRDVMARYRNKLVYDANTGEIKDDRNYMSMLEDFWLPSREGGDELKFTKFVQRLRKKFTELFNDILRTQLVLKGIIAEQDWATIRDSIQYDFLQDGHFAELKQTELLRERLALANEMREYIGKFFSVEYIRKNVLKQNQREIETMDKQIVKEIKDGIIQDPTVQVNNNNDEVI